MHICTEYKPLYETLIRNPNSRIYNKVCRDHHIPIFCRLVQMHHSLNAFSSRSINPLSFCRNLNLIVAYDVIHPMVDLFIMLNNSAENIVKAHSGENS